MDERLRRSRKQEKDGAKRFGGTINPGSGNTGGRKNDVTTPTESIEFKSTGQSGYRLTRTDLEVAWQHALLADKRMVFGIQWERMANRGTPKRWVVIAEDDYLEDQELKRQAADKIEVVLIDLAAANERITDLEQVLLDEYERAHCASCDGHACPDAC